MGKAQEYADFRRGFEIYFSDGTGNKAPAVWTSKDGTTHRAVGAQMISTDRGTFIMWTACGKHDIPANKSWIQRAEDRVTCPGCQATDKVFDEEERERGLENSPFGVGA